MAFQSGSCSFVRLTVWPGEMLKNESAMPPTGRLETTRIQRRVEALEVFTQVFALRQGDRVLCLTDPLLDPRVIAAVRGLAQARGASVSVFEASHPRQLAIPDAVRPLIEQATVVVSTWFCSVLDPFCVAQRTERGQRWVKLTYFRNLDLLDTPHARFPLSVLSEIIQATAAGLPRGAPWTLHISDERGSDFRIGYTAEMTEALLATSRWQGRLAADHPGAYVHYLPTHGPNLYQRNLALLGRPEATRLDIEGVIYPQWAVGFVEPFADPIGVHFARDEVVEVTGDSPAAAILADMLVGGRLIELGCGFNPAYPRRLIYPAGSNAAGALHYGIDLAHPSDYLRRVLPDWEEPPVHMDLCLFDATVRAGEQTLVESGMLAALDAPSVVAQASHYGDPLALLSAQDAGARP